MTGYVVVTLVCAGMLVAAAIGCYFERKGPALIAAASLIIFSLVTAAELMGIKPAWETSGYVRR